MGCSQSQEQNVVSPSGGGLDFLNEKKKSNKIECDLVSLGGYSRSPLNVDHDPVSRYTGNEMQAIYEVIYSKDWEAAAVLLKDRRFTKYLTHLDRNGRTCLHWACMKKAPLSIIELLLHEYADALLQVDSFGQTPIHSAVEYCSQEVISLMLKKKKNSSTLYSYGKDKSGSTTTPLTLAILCGRNPTIIKLLLLSDPTQVIVTDKQQNKNGVVPLEIFFRRHFRDIIGYSNNIDPFTGFSSKVISNDTVIQEIYRIASYMLQAVTYTEPLKVETDNHQNQKRKKNNDFVIVDSWNILHAAIECPQCPHQFVDLILRLHPEQATRLDQTKQSPLHLACALTSKSTSIYNIQLDMNEAINDEQSKTDDDKLSACIKTLVKSNPELTKQVDGNGNYPLHIALKEGKSWEDGMNDLVLAYPDALFILDHNEKLYPFMMAATPTTVNDVQNLSPAQNKNKEEGVILTTIFNLLRNGPDILQDKYITRITLDTKKEKIAKKDEEEEKEEKILKQKTPVDVSTNNNESQVSNM